MVDCVHLECQLVKSVSVNREFEGLVAEDFFRVVVIDFVNLFPFCRVGAVESAKNLVVVIQEHEAIVVHSGPAVVGQAVCLAGLKLYAA